MPKDDVVRLRQFAAMLGWHGLRELRHIVRDDAPGISSGSVIRWYESGSVDEVLLQINVSPYYHAAVYALRYRLCTGWHRFTLYVDTRKVAPEAAKLELWLHRKWFTTIEKRREFRAKHPECCNYTWRRIRTDGLPHECT